MGRGDLGPAPNGATAAPDGRLIQVIDVKVLNQAVDWALARNKVPS
ncbi:MAG: hypothetical protein M3Y79_11440 [Pseudomonadota bacterium]|nr:hypothetical protein [Pseudomonadota bacterium]